MHDGKIALVFAGDERAFRLGFAELLALEEGGRPVSEMMERFTVQRWYLRDVRDILRIGLQGGGMEPAMVRQLLDEVLPGNVYEAAAKARLVLAAGLMPLQGDESPGEGQGGEAPPENTNASTPQGSSAKARSSASRRRKRSP